MKILYTFLAFFATAITRLNAQTTVIPPTASATSVEKNNMVYRTSAAEDSIFSHIYILPNLAKGKITLKVDDANPNVIQQGECIIFNSGGAAVAKSPFTTGTNEIYVTTLPAGMYFLRLVQKNGQVASRKFVVTR